MTWNQAALALRVGDPQRGTARGDLSSAGLFSPLCGALPLEAEEALGASFGARETSRAGLPNAHARPPVSLGLLLISPLLIFRACSLLPQLPGDHRAFCACPGREGGHTGIGLRPEGQGPQQPVRSHVSGRWTAHPHPPPRSPPPPHRQHFPQLLALPLSGRVGHYFSGSGRELEMAPRQGQLGILRSESRAAGILSFRLESRLHTCNRPAAAPPVSQPPLSPAARRPQRHFPQ